VTREGDFLKALGNWPISLPLFSARGDRGSLLSFVNSAQLGGLHRSHTAAGPTQLLAWPFFSPGPAEPWRASESSERLAGTGHESGTCWRGQLPMECQLAGGVCGQGQYTGEAGRHGHKLLPASEFSKVVASCRRICVKNRRAPMLPWRWVGFTG
jgi:hypothetical protein